MQREGFRVDAGNWESRQTIGKNKFPGMAGLMKRSIKRLPRSGPAFSVLPSAGKGGPAHPRWNWIESMMAIFEEVTPAMKLCMQIQLQLYTLTGAGDEGKTAKSTTKTTEGSPLNRRNRSGR